MAHRPTETCIRCGESPAIDADDYCGHCRWQLEREIEAGIDDLYIYLAQRAGSPTDRKEI